MSEGIDLVLEVKSFVVDFEYLWPSIKIAREVIKLLYF